jgi:hypothetical protein
MAASFFVFLAGSSPDRRRKWLQQADRDLQ